MSFEPLLKAQGMAKAYGGVKALDGAAISASEGEIVGLIGPNGSGKTTFINAISGLIRVDAGAIRFAGTEITHQAPHRRVHHGINRTFQIAAPFHRLTVLENVQVATAYGQGNSEPLACLARVGLAGRESRLAGSLNSTEQKLLDLARALATSPRLLLVDEIAAGLNPDEALKLSELLKALASSGLSLIVVEHLIPFVRTLADRVVVMDRGAVIFNGPTDDALADERVTEVFLGHGGDRKPSQSNPG